MKLNVIREDETLTHIALVGRLDIEGAQSIELTFLGHTVSRGKPVLIDMSDVEYIMSLGIRMLLSASQALNRKGTTCMLIHLQPFARDTLTKAGLDGLFAPTDDDAEAIRLLLEQ